MNTINGDDWKKGNPDYDRTERSIALNTLNRRREESYLSRAPLKLMRGHQVIVAALNYADSVISLLDVPAGFPLSRVVATESVPQLAALDDTPFWDTQEDFAAVSESCETVRVLEIDYVSHHHLVADLTASVRVDVLRAGLFREESSMDIDLDGQKTTLTLREASEARRLGLDEARQILDIVAIGQIVETLRGLREDDAFFREAIDALTKYNDQSPLEKEFFRAWKLFYPGKPGEDYECVADAPPEVRKAVFWQADEQSRRREGISQLRLANAYHRDKAWLEKYEEFQGVGKGQPYVAVLEWWNGLPHDDRVRLAGGKDYAGQLPDYGRGTESRKKALDTIREGIGRATSDRELTKNGKHS